jgi:hypothetical protein
VSTIHHSTTVATSVPTLTAAWAFVMEHIDAVGDAPSVHIGPVWNMDDELHFEVAVSGTKDEEATT